MNNFSNIRLEDNNKEATITKDRPKFLNAQNQKKLEEIAKQQKRKRNR